MRLHGVLPTQQIVYPGVGRRYAAVLSIQPLPIGVTKGSNWLPG